MPKFRFAVRSKEGKLRTGSVNEANLEAAKERLKGAGFLIVSLAEEAELVILETKARPGKTTLQHGRANIIEFETSFGERLGEFLSTFVLRKEFALILFVAGAALAGYNFVNRPRPGPSTEPKFLPLSVEVSVDPGNVKGDTYVAVLPDIPLRFTEKVSAPGSVVMKTSFEAIRQPGRVEVSLLSATGETVAEGDALLSIKKEGLLTGSVVLDRVKPRAPVEVSKPKTPRR